MSKINYDLTKIKTFIFDVDGVLSPACIPLSETGEPIRMVNIKDGYALNLASRSGYELAIITGGNSEAVRQRFLKLGFKHIYMKSSTKINDLNDFLTKTNSKLDEIVYVGDDIPDYQVMKQVGLSVAPADAAPEVKDIATYVCPYKGGEGVARDIIEQVMKAQGKWMEGTAFGW